MNRNEQIQLDVLDELAYDPAVDSSSVEVTVTAAGVVTLKGRVPAYMQARAAERAAKRVRGVKAVANDLEVKPPEGFGLDDTGVAEASLQALRWSASVPKDAVRVTITRGWITLEGKVDWDYQRRAAYEAVRDLRGVRGVSNLIEIKPSAKASEVRAQIEGAFRRNAQLDADHVTVEVVGHRVTLRGSVGSWSEKETAERAAFAAPGVISVDNRIEVHAPALF
jgi:osmotically-inducible protein OsmY